MKDVIVHSLEPITLVGGAQVSAFDLEEVLKFAPRLIAADAGLDRALAAGAVPEAVIGDLDSVSNHALSQLEVENHHLITEQDSTDFDKALRHVSAPVVVAIGFAGGRIDHQLAAIHTLLARADQPCVILAKDEIIFLAQPHMVLPTKAGDTVSLYPLAPVTGRSTGLQWPIEGLAFDPASKIGTSNCAQGEVELTFADPGMLVIVPRAIIQPVVASLTAPGAARWPVRAERHKGPRSA